MNQLTNLSEDASQSLTHILGDGTTVQLAFRYRGALQRWTVDVSYPKTGFVANGLGLATHPNLLRAWRNSLPLGLMVASSDGADPFLIGDLASGRISVYVLDGTNGGTDLQDVEAEYFS